MHYWGDKFKYFADVGIAADEIGAFCVKYGRISVTQTKEKYGTARVYCSFGWTCLHSLLFPRYICKHPKFPKWLWKLDIYYIGPILRFLFAKPIYSYQKFIYRLAYKKAIKKYPHIREEILNGADWDELLKGL